MIKALLILLIAKSCFALSPIQSPITKNGYGVGFYIDINNIKESFDAIYNDKVIKKNTTSSFSYITPYIRKGWGKNEIKISILPLLYYNTLMLNYKRKFFSLKAGVNFSGYTGILLNYMYQNELGTISEWIGISIGTNRKKLFDLILNTSFNLSKFSQNTYIFDENNENMTHGSINENSTYIQQDIGFVLNQKGNFSLSSIIGIKGYIRHTQNDEVNKLSELKYNNIKNLVNFKISVNYN